MTLTSAWPRPLWRQGGKWRHSTHPSSNHILPFLQLPLPPSLDFDVDDFISSYQKMDVMEKAMVCPYKASFDPSIRRMESKSTFVTNSTEKITFTDSTKSLELPPKRQSTFIRRLRFLFLTTYNQLFSLVFLLNLAGLMVYLLKPQNITLKNISTWASSNFLVAILVRQDFFINGLFQTAWWVPWRTPLRLRRLFVRVYSYGGLHTGTAVAGTLWWTGFTGLSTARFPQQGLYAAPLFILTWIVQLLLLLIGLFACPHFRSASHNTFEYIHRFGGWISIELLWIHLLLSSGQEHLASEVPLGMVLIRQPTFWNLTAMTVLLLMPWLRLRKWTFKPQRLSDHAMQLHFSNPVHRFACLAISTSPLHEWHPFATFPSADRRPGGSMVISAAGDWTRQLIASPRTSYWVKGSPKVGVLSLTVMFRRVIIVTTGSGIGPCISSLVDGPKDQFCRLIWSTPTPVETFGKEMTQWVTQVDPDAVIIDTRVTGRPDLVRLAYKMYLDCDAEAVFVLSNRTVTKKVVYGLESRGIPAYGPIFDS